MAEIRNRDSRSHFPFTTPQTSINMSLPNTQPLTHFLTLAPATSASYPRVQSTQAVEPLVNANAAPRPAAQRRSSSVSSGYKVLKLGPVHWGEHQDEHKEDFHEVSPSA
ncbi:hypothetical protein HJFPF1_01271 [Paramyrothecium foliicola]|nr:hypothetical protein HJFPF1_01271 [Paramyrothecium foliicola]